MTQEIIIPDTSCFLMEQRDIFKCDPLEVGGGEYEFRRYVERKFNIVIFLYYDHISGKMYRLVFEEIHTATIFKLTYC